MSTDPIPWYRQFWPWFLIALPASSVCAGIATVLIASADPDGLVTDDYYRQGLAINQDLARQRVAEQRGLRGRLSVDAATGGLRLALAGQLVAPDRLTLRLVHPTRSYGDHDAVLYRDRRGELSGQLRLPAGGRWRVLVEPDDGRWRLSGRLVIGTQTGPTVVALTPG